MLLQRKNDSRDASSRSRRRDRRRRRARSAGSRSTRKTNFGLASMRRSASSMPVSNVPPSLPAAAGRTSSSAPDVLRRDVAAIGAARQRREDARARTALPRRPARGPADEDAAAARRIAGARRIERTGQDHLVDVRTAREVDGVGRAADVVCSRRVFSACVFSRNATAIVVRTGLERHAHREAAVHVVAGRRRVLARGGDLLVAAERGEVHALAVHGDLELVLDTRARASCPRLVRNSLTWNWYSPSSGSVALDQDAADRAERQALDVAILRRVLPDADTARRSAACSDRRAPAR